MQEEASPVIEDTGAVVQLQGHYTPFLPRTNKQCRLKKKVAERN